MAPHSRTLAWKTSWMEEPGRLQSVGSRGVGHDWATSLSLFTFMHWRRKWQPTPVFLPGESQGRRSLVGCRLWGRQSRMTEATQQQQQQHCFPICNGPCTCKTHHALFLLPSTDWLMGCHPRLAMVTNAAVNIASVHGLDFHSFWYICRSGIAGSHGNSIFEFWVITTVLYIVNSCLLTVHKDAKFFTSLQPVPSWVFDCTP